MFVIFKIISCLNFELIVIISKSMFLQLIILTCSSFKLFDQVNFSGSFVDANMGSSTVRQFLLLNYVVSNFELMSHYFAFF